MSQSEFARCQLLKHGWTEGSGLGREETGIKEAIKVHLKNNKTGIGHDQSVEFTHHWWQDKFNETASSIQVETTLDGSVHVKRNKKKEKAMSKKAKSTMYGSFIKGATLKQKNGQHVEENDWSSTSSEEDNMKACHKPSEVELFEECDGRTAHKGARHGLGLNGKLQRIQAMEEEFLKQITTKGVSREQEIQDTQLKQIDRVSQKSKGIKKKKKETSGSDDCSDLGHGEERRQHKKKKTSVTDDCIELGHSEEKRKQKKRRKKEKTSVADDCSDIDGEEMRKRKKKGTSITDDCNDLGVAEENRKRKKQKTSVTDDCIDLGHSEHVEESRQHKKKKTSVTDDCSDLGHSELKRKKKKKKHQ